MLVTLTFSDVNNAGHNTCNASFLAPCGVTSPFSRMPPSILKVPISLLMNYKL